MMRIVVVVCLACCFGGCSRSQEPSEVTDLPAGNELLSQDQIAPLPVDGVTSATPGVASSTLLAAHAGWGNPACGHCHADGHQAGFPPAACAGCHGTNGAVPRQVRAEHSSNDNCTACHAQKHQQSSFTAADCRACHGFQESQEVCGTEEQVDVVVIGAGGGGLAAAAALAKGGKDVVVLEQNYKVGGCMATFRRGTTCSKPLCTDSTDSMPSKA